MKESWGLEEFRHRQPKMSVIFREGGGLGLSGQFCFRAQHGSLEIIEDSFSIDIRISREFPKEIPRVFERGDRIPPEFHQFTDGRLCLGSRLRLREILKRNPTLLGFSEKVLVPYFYSFLFQERHGNFPFGELKHGFQGLIDDYQRMLGVNGLSQVVLVLKLLRERWSIARKMDCPCESGKKFGKCHGPTTRRLQSVLSRTELGEEADLLLALCKQELEELKRIQSSAH